MWGYVVVWIASLIIAAAAMRPRSQTGKPASLEDYNVPVAEVGRPFGVTFGTRKIEGANVIAYYGYRTSAVKQKSKK